MFRICKICSIAAVLACGTTSFATTNDVAMTSSFVIGNYSKFAQDLDAFTKTANLPAFLIDFNTVWANIMNFEAIEMIDFTKPMEIFFFKNFNEPLVRLAIARGTEKQVLRQMRSRHYSSSKNWSDGSKGFHSPKCAVVLNGQELTFSENPLLFTAWQKSDLANRPKISSASLSISLAPEQYHLIPALTQGLLASDFPKLKTNLDVQIVASATSMTIKFSTFDKKWTIDAFLPKYPAISILRDAEKHNPNEFTPIKTMRSIFTQLKKQRFMSDKFDTPDEPISWAAETGILTIPANTIQLMKTLTPEFQRFCINLLNEQLTERGDLVN